MIIQRPHYLEMLVKGQGNGLVKIVSFFDSFENQSVKSF